MAVKWANGGTLGTIEEGFIARLNRGDCFVFAGRVLEYLRTQDMAAFVRLAPRRRGVVPSWNGSRMPLSSELAASVQDLLEEAAVAAERLAAAGVEAGAGNAEARGGGDAPPDFADPEMRAAWPMLQAQARLSRLPRRGHLLVERHTSREGMHLFIYPFGGRHVHIGLAQLLAWRLARQQANTYSLSVNDYGFEILAARPLPADVLRAGELFTTRDLLADVLASLNSGALAQRRFREIARVAGLVFGGYPGAPKSLRQVQASSSLFFEVFRKHDAGNRLLGQAAEEVLAQELDIARLASTLAEMAALPVVEVTLRVPSPFALPLMVQRLREGLSTEKLQDRLDRMLAEAEGALAPPAPAAPAPAPPRARRRRVAAAGVTAPACGIIAGPQGERR
jgi:ATP-dependent Lhr-like helicase